MSSEKKDEVVIDVKMNFIPIYGGFDILDKYLKSSDICNNLPSEKRDKIIKKSYFGNSKKFPPERF